MKTIRFENAHRRKHFDYFKAMDQPHYGLTAEITITPLLRHLQEQGRSFTPTMAYLVARCANDLRNFRWRIRNGEVIEHETIQPSYTVQTDVSDVFSFCTVPYDPDYTVFYDRAIETMQRMKKDPSFEDEAGRDNYLFISVVPWVSFTHIQHPMHYHPTDTIPRLAWGRYRQISDAWQMPLSVQAHHALVDGRDLGVFFTRFQEYCSEPQALL